MSSEFKSRRSTNPITDRKTCPCARFTGALPINSRSQGPGEVSLGLKEDAVLSAEEQREIVNQFQGYVERMEKPPKGRRKTIAAEKGFPYRRLVLAIRSTTYALFVMVSTGYN
jgi:hypothetical protein